EGMAQRSGVRAGDVVQLVSPRPTLTPLGPQPRERRVPIAGTFSTGRTEQDERVALPYALAAALLGTADPRLEIEAGGLEQALAVAPALAAALPAGTQVRTWQDINRGL